MPFLVVAAIGLFLFVRQARAQPNPMAAAACWLTIGVGALLFAIGLMEQIYFEPTEEALASATTGRWRMLVGVIVATAGLTANYHRRRHQP